MKRVIITSGFFNPIHIGHINLIKEAKKLGDFLVVIINNDAQVDVKESAHFMPEKERVAIIKGLKDVDEVFLSVDKDISVAKSLRAVAKKYKGKEILFAKGGDRNINNIPESERKVCQEFNIKVVSGVGGGKVQSSSWLVRNVINRLFLVRVLEDKLQKMPSMEVLGNKVQIIGMPDAIELVDFWIKSEASKCHWIVATGMRGIMESHRRIEFGKMLSSSNLWVPDGISLVWLAKLNGFKIKKRLTGPDLFHELLKKRYKHYLYGETPETLSLLSEKLSSQMPGIKIVSSPESSKDQDIIKKINKTKPDILWVDLGLPKQEEWIFKHLKSLKVPVVIGVGGSFKFEAGIVKRAPEWVGNSGFEWLWRLIVEPSKAWKKLFVDVPQFIWLVGNELVKNRKKTI